MVRFQSFVLFDAYLRSQSTGYRDIDTFPLKYVSSIYVWTGLPVRATRCAMGVVEVGYVIRTTFLLARLYRALMTPRLLDV